ncbi:Homoserine dehydrogenase [Calidithermus terrae]|uniref:Homoserine dehydrogenase n=1 Tax=Calidithermus terrae TaxID=1408545 RepID=A0A399ELC3_9DEIN|nr:homoserine dehydrogenase [Calidithermus terrae]RIH83869.1 Homoserine dehydrogenase [Calidithermus terrae]
METVRIALLGAGTVGSSLVELLEAHRARLEAFGYRAELVSVLVRDAGKPRPGIPAHLLTADPGALAEADVLIEVMGGTERAGDLVLRALEAGTPVITANKALLAERWGELRGYAEAGLLYYEASVMAGTPVIGALQSLWGNRLLELHAILNGTCNYILNRLEAGVPYAQALEEAQAKGYAEADPTLDVGGFDAAHKLTVLARLTADPGFAWEGVKANTRGIEALTPERLGEARAGGQVIRLVGSLFPQDGRWVGKVRPVRLPASHPLALMGSARNALVCRTQEAGELVFSGAGAGGHVTASAVLGDLYRLVAGQPGHLPIPAPLPVPQVQVEALDEV